MLDAHTHTIYFSLLHLFIFFTYPSIVPSLVAALCLDLFVLDLAWVSLFSLAFLKREGVKIGKGPHYPAQ